MKKIFAVIAMLAIALPAMAATPAAGRGRSMSKQNDGRAAVSKKHIENVAATNTGNVSDEDTDTGGDTTTPEETPDEPAKDMRERERAACIQNNIGVGATFVWASKYSNTANYASMVEDVEFPENNVCFVKVGVKSNDSRIDVSDIPTKYYVMGDTIKCGEWANEETLEARILAAKKKGRTWATVGGVVGGAGIGVGAMELFGNKLIGGKVEGQAALEGTELLCSQMKTLKQEKSSKYNDIVDALTEMKNNCENTTWPDGQKPEDCTAFDYEALLKC